MKPEMREPIRSDAKELSPRERAAARAAEIRKHNGSDFEEANDEFAAPTAPDGWTYEWKRRTVFGAEDPAHMVELRRQGWEEVPTKRHPEMMPHKTDAPHIERKGMVLMERPTELVNDSRNAELRKARAQVRVKEAQLNESSPGQFERDVNGLPVGKGIKKGYTPLPIADE